MVIIGTPNGALGDRSGIAEHARDPRRREIECQNPIRIVAENPLEPMTPIVGAPARASSAQFGTSTLNLGGARSGRLAQALMREAR